MSLKKYLSCTKATPTEIATVLVALSRIGSEFKPDEGNVFKSGLLNNVLRLLPTIRDPARSFLDAMNLKEARENDEAGLWSDPDKYPDIQDAKDVSCQVKPKSLIERISALLYARANSISISKRYARY